MQTGPPDPSDVPAAAIIRVVNQHYALDAHGPLVLLGLLVVVRVQRYATGSRRAAAHDA